MTNLNTFPCFINPEPFNLSICKDLAAFLELNSEKLFKETWIQNQVDTIVELVYKTIYKLENLK